MSKDHMSADCSADIKNDNSARSADFDLTKSQTLILTGQQLQPDEPHYNMILVFRISGQLDYDYFQTAFQTLVDQCDALRTVIISTAIDASTNQTQDTTYKQRVFSHFDYDVKLVDFSNEQDPEAGAKQWIDRHKKINFNLAQCLFESVLLKLSDNQYCWYFNQHHLLTDAWSMGVVFKHVQNCYSQAKKGQLAQVKPLPNFQNYVVLEQSKQLTKPVINAQKFWQKQLSVPFIPSSFYRPTPKIKSAITHRIPCAFGVERSRRLRILAQQPAFVSFSPDLSIMQLFATMLFTFLHRVSGNHKLSIGTPSHSRTSAELKKTVGLLINIFPLQIEILENETFLSLYHKVAESNQQLLMNAMPGAADFQQNRVFDVLLNFIPSSFGDFDQFPTQSEWVHSDYGDRNHLLRLQVHNFDRKDEFTLFFDLNDELFVGEEKQWVVAHFLRIVDAMLADAEQAIGVPALICTTAKLPYQNTIVTTQNSIKDQPLITDLFDQQAKRSINNTALVCGPTSISYQHLDLQSYQIAQHLVDHGITSGSVVAVMMTRSIEVVCAIMGILKSGAAFLPIDLNYPQERIKFMLEDANVNLIITGPKNTDLVQQFNQNYLCIDGDFQCKKISAQQQPLPKITATDTAYIIYTSGSTGRPKGVPILHAGLSNYIRWAKDYYLAGKALNFALFSSLSFDLTITSLFVPLIAGSKLIIYAESNDASDITIRNVIEDNQVEIIKLTPAHLALIQVMDFSKSRLQKLIVGGDDFKTDLAQTIVKYFAGKIAIFNEYGPTEATVACTVHRYNPSVDTDTSVPIGRPIDNANIYILDAYKNLLPQGVTGEIYITGVGLADGYLNQSKLTQQRFVTIPDLTAQQLYRTGDLARFNVRGEIEYLGRNDQQLKVRGVRIETGEIEAALLGIENVSDAIVDIAEHLALIEENLQVEHCVKCGLAANHPSAQLDNEKVCRICRVYQQQEKQAQAYYRDSDQLKRWIAKIKRESSTKQNCIMLLSGGKDSSYALCKLVDLGLTPLVFSLDNGFISEGAKTNIQRLVERLDLELVVGTTPAMNAIFVDSLTRFSNVCNGCFKTIYTLSMNLAKERGIKVICTGLSRGQIFETRVAHLFQQGCFDASKIDDRINDARKAYHRTQDIIATTLDVELFKDDNIFNEIQYLDFYRYTDVTLDEMYQYLNNIAPWIRPSDTGRSTNCLINDAGIYVHKKERGYHNYALPYSWDVRLGHKQRNAALEELNDELDQQKVDKILKQVGYQSRDVKPIMAREDKLIAYYVAPAEIQKNTLQKQLSTILPSEYIPSQFVWMSALPLTANGKVDRQALPRPSNSRRELTVDYVAPVSEVETTLAMLWSKLLGVAEVGVADNFFDLGGDSIVNIQIVSAARDKGIELTPQQVFDYPTIKQLADVAGRVSAIAAEQGAVSGQVPLLPSQVRFFNENRQDLDQYNQSIMLKYIGSSDKATLNTNTLQLALDQILVQHDGLRSCFKQTDSGWQQYILEQKETRALVVEFELPSLSDKDADIETELERQTQRLMHKLDIHNGTMVAVANVNPHGPQTNYLLIVIHHLVMDGVSWWVLLSDLEQCYNQLADNKSVQLPRKTCSVKQWALGLTTYAQSVKALTSAQYWQISSSTPATLPFEQNSLLGNLPKVASINSVSSFLTKAETQQLIHELPGTYGVQVPEVIVTSLLQVILPWSGSSQLTLDIEGHGREQLIEGLDVTRTISWFTSIYPMSLHLSKSGQLGDDLKAIKQQLRAVPNRGIEYGMLRYLRNESAGAEGLIKQIKNPVGSDVLFNYMGQWERTLADNSQFKFVRPIQACYGNDRLLRHGLEINAMVFDGKLQVDWTFDENRFSSGTVKLVSQKFIHALQTLIQYCLSTEDSGFTATDFGTDEIAQDDLDDIFEEFGE